ncbi:MAG: PTS sugar transporter subunit IIA [Caulobacteraceae bacterium]|nr:PTS sugar transporter subunit IIA [Caulobacteraceae bacterium]
MDIGALLPADGIVLRSGVTTKRQALHAVADVAAQAYGLDAQAVYDALNEREALGSTALGSGVAVPHARISGMAGVNAVFVKLDQPVAFGALDDRPVDLLLGLFAAPEDGAGHLRALAAASRALRASELRDQLRAAEKADAVRALLMRQSQAQAA